MSMYAAYLSDEEMERACSEEQFIRHMLTFEMALANAEAKVGIIPHSAAQAIQAKLSQITINPSDLAEGTLKNGIPTIPFLSNLKEQLPAAAKDFLHLGATSQDVLDTAQVLMIKEAVSILEGHIRKLLYNLLTLVERDGQIPCIARTRWQQATPIPFGLKVVNWAMPFVRDLERLQEMKKRLLVVQLGGASGSLAALEHKGYQVLEALANELHLGVSLPWHTQRDSFTEFTNWLTLVSATLGKMGEDVLLMAQTEVGEVIENAQGGGKSSAMPHKNNPVLSEALVGLSKATTNLSALQMQSMLQAGERDGTSWMLEWRNIPQMLINTATALKHAITVSTHMQINKERMLENINLTNGLVYAEQAVSFLSRQLPKSEASSLVNKAIELVNKDKSLPDALTEVATDRKMNWQELLQPEACFGSSREMMATAINRIKEVLPT
ncbi:adenylosuccinate lyase family protein [Rhodocytophaga aerolata]|uniref:Adenylosuccinate lyase family protein n=1 Tax=Rhodocytophaga aerolata TaxID=455078 RepID=A0ABT8QZ02_9BACT|nr:adenylosuccinate lyase family protein [Rhodocytophaga aerolata]MDO1445070.1 adenylosuccinate lyase family protein [Rhodocytophaga aerolata]